jgi:CobW/HypB/UreG, nucleotide-binding domain
MYIPLLVVLVSAFRFSNAFGPLPLKAVRPFVSKTTKAANNNGNASSDAPAVLASSTTSKDRTIPITLLSGFLGAGKTCALKNLLENKDDLKIGVIVNDVAKINIDAKLVAGQAGDLLELQNGCVCCSLSSELVFAVEKLISGRLSSRCDRRRINRNCRPKGNQAVLVGRLDGYSASDY